MGIGTEGLADLTIAAKGLLRTGRQLFIGEADVDAAAGNVNHDDVAVLQLADVATAGCLGRDVADAQAARAAREASVGDEGALLAEVHTFDIRGRVEHLLHSGPALGSFVGDNDAVARLHPSAQDALAGIFLTVEDDGWSLEVPKAGVNACGLHHASVLCYVAEEDCHATVLRVGMLDVAYATVCAVSVEAFPTSVLRPHDIGELAAWCTAVDAFRFGVDGFAGDAVLGNVFSQRSSVHAFAGKVKQASFSQFTHYAENAARTVLFLDAVLLPVGCKFAEEGYLAAQGVNVLHLEINFAFLSHGQQMEHGVGRGAHSNVERHGIEEGLSSGDAAGQDTLVAVLIVCEGVLYDEAGSILEELYAILVCSQDAAVAGQ